MNIVLFDIECLFCNKSVKYLNKLDKKDRLYFGSLADVLLFENKLNIQIKEENKLVLINNNQVYYGGRAIIKILGLIDYYKPIIWVLTMLPIRFIDFGYAIISKNRYLFGRNASCAIDHNIKSKMIDAKNIDDYIK